MVLLLKRWVSGFLFVVAVVYVGLTCFLDLGLLYWSLFYMLECGGWCACGALRLGFCGVC